MHSRYRRVLSYEKSKFSKAARVRLEDYSDDYYLYYFSALSARVRIPIAREM